MTAEGIRCEELRPGHWSDLEKLFGSNGACGGCWCMYWRQEKGEPWDQVKGREAKRRFRALVRSGEAQGVLAFRGSEPVGWLAVGQRTAFVKLNRAPSLKCDDAGQVHALPCFFVHRDHRNEGVARELLRAAVKLLAQQGARIVEGYPVRTLPDGRSHPAAFAYTGTECLFAREGFVAADDRAKGKLRMRKQLSRRTSAADEGKRTIRRLGMAAPLALSLLTPEPAVPARRGRPDECGAVEFVQGVACADKAVVLDRSDPGVSGCCAASAATGSLRNRRCTRVPRTGPQGRPQQGAPPREA